MRLKAPPLTTLVQSPTAIYPLDGEGCIEVPPGHPDNQLFAELGFQPVGDNPLAVPHRDEPETTTAPDLEQADHEGDQA